MKDRDNEKDLREFIIKILELPRKKRVVLKAFIAGLQCNEEFEKDFD